EQLRQPADVSGEQRAGQLAERRLAIERGGEPRRVDRIAMEPDLPPDGLDRRAARVAQLDVDEEVLRVGLLERAVHVPVDRLLELDARHVTEFTAHRSSPASSASTRKIFFRARQMIIFRFSSLISSRADASR